MTQQNALEQAINSLKQDTSNIGQGIWNNITSTERAPGTGTNEPIPWGQMLQKGWEDVQRNNPVYRLVSNVGDTFGHPLPQAPTLSPLPDYMNWTSGMEYKMKQDEALAAEAAKAGLTQPLNLTLNYPDWMGYPNSAPPMPTGPNPSGPPSALQQARSQIIQVPGTTNVPYQQTTPQNIPTPRVTPAPQTLVHPDFANFVNEQLLPLTRKYGIPDAVAAAQAAQESGYNLSPGAGQYNYWGLKSNSPDPTKKGKFANFDSLEAAVKYYAETLQSKVPNGDLSQYENNPMELLRMIQSNPTNQYERHNPDPMQYVYDTTNNPYWQAYGGGASMTANPNGWLGAKPKLTKK